MNFNNISSTDSASTSTPIGIYDSYVYSNNLYTNFLQLRGGNMIGPINTNSNINFTNNTIYTNPIVGISTIPTGDRIILRNASSSSTYGYTIGIANDSLWLSSPTSIQLYTNGINRFSIDNNGNIYGISNILANNLSGSGVNLTDINYNNITSNPLIFNLPFIKDNSNIVSFNNENLSEFIFPPLPLNTSITTISNISNNYGNGIYIINASSTGVNNYAYYAFNNTTTNAWEISTTSSYTTLGGTVNPPIYNPSSGFSTVVSNKIINGEWIQIYYDKGFAATYLTISGFTTSGDVNINNGHPAEFTLAASNDEIIWNFIMMQTNISSYTSPNISKTFSINNSTIYKYYRLIVTKTIANGKLEIALLSFKGRQYTLFLNNDSFNSIIYNTNENIIIPRTYDRLPTSETPLLNEIFNCSPINPFKQTLTINNQSYDIYSSSTIGTNFKSALFDNNNSTVANWALNQYSSGIYNNDNYIYNNSYKGDWIIIRFPFKIILTRFIFYQSTVSPNNSPKTWKCYGSNDGSNFIEITDASELTGITYINNIYTKTIYNIPPYQYIGWVFNTLMASSATQLIFADIYIFGKENLSNYFSNVWIKSDNNIYNNIANIGIGTSTNLNSNLTVNGRTLFNDIASFSNSIFQSNPATPNYFAAKVGIGSSDFGSNLFVGNPGNSVIMGNLLWK